MYEEIKRLVSVLMNVGNVLQGQHPELLCTKEKMNLFDGTEGLNGQASKKSHPGFYNLNDDLKAEASSPERGSEKGRVRIYGCQCSSKSRQGRNRDVVQGDIEKQG